MRIHFQINLSLKFSNMGTSLELRSPPISKYSRFYWRKTQTLSKFSESNGFYWKIFSFHFLSFLWDFRANRKDQSIKLFSPSFKDTIFRQEGLMTSFLFASSWEKMNFSIFVLRSKTQVKWMIIRMERIKITQLSDGEISHRTPFFENCLIKKIYF